MELVIKWLPYPHHLDLCFIGCLDKVKAVICFECTVRCRYMAFGMGVHSLFQIKQHLTVDCVLCKYGLASVLCHFSAIDFKIIDLRILSEMMTTMCQIIHLSVPLFLSFFSLFLSVSLSQRALKPPVKGSPLRDSLEVTAHMRTLQSLLQ